MPQLNLRLQDPKTQREDITGVIGGLNDFQDQTLIKATELTEAKNIIIDIDGISPRFGNIHNGDQASDSKIYGGVAFYKSNGVRENLRISGGRLKKYNAGTWIEVSSTVFSNLNTDLIQVRDQVLCFNGTDDLRIYDGSSVTTVTALITPVGLAVTPTGGTASTAYSYRIAAFNSRGETLAGSSVSIVNGVATLSSTSYNALAWTAVTGASGYNVYGNKASGIGHVYMQTVYTNAYNDTGADEPDPNKLPQEANTTAGLTAAFAAFALQRVFAAGDPNNPSRLYWGGLGANVTNFSQATEGGGYVDVYKNDGGTIRAVKSFQGGVIIGKDNGIYKFSFTETGLPKLEEITRSFGMISHRGAQAVENDLIFIAIKDGRAAFYSLGNQENYASTVLRTNELSIKVSAKLKDVELSMLGNSAGFYYQNIFGCAVTVRNGTHNERIWCLDTRFGSWFYWEETTPNCFWPFNDGTEINLEWGDEISGYTWHAFREDRADNGLPIEVKFATRAFTAEIPYRVKKLYALFMQFKDINQSGGITLDIIVDGSVTEKTAAITTPDIGGAGIGQMLLGGFLLGEAKGGTGSTSNSPDQIIQIYDPSLQGRSVKFVFRSTSTNLMYRFMGIWFDYQITERPVNTIIY